MATFCVNLSEIGGDAEYVFECVYECVAVFMYIYPIFIPIGVGTGGAGGAMAPPLIGVGGPTMLTGPPTFQLSS